MKSSEEILEEAAENGGFGDEWPRVLEAVVSKLEWIVQHEFPPPPPPQSQPAHLPSDSSTLKSSSPPPLKLDETSSQATESTNKETAEPTSTPSKPPVPSFSETTAPSTQDGAKDSQIPPDVLGICTSIISTLRANFPNYPPYTVQRLSELVLRPKTHYRFLPSYLRALDRVISVSSSTNHFPLYTNSSSGGGALTNGSSPHTAALGSDESLGGALLTPIPWLKSEPERSSTISPPNGQAELKSESTEVVQGPNGVGKIETVTVVNGVMTTTTTASTSPTSPNSTEEILRAEGAVTQGELLRQEQEAGVVPVSYTSPRRAVPSQGTGASDSIADTIPSSEGAEDNMQEEHPHARGPEEIGMEDMGPQEVRPAGSTGLDIEAAVGRKASPEQGDPKGEQTQDEGTAESAGDGKEDADENANKKSKDETMTDVDVAAKVALANAPGHEPKVDTEDAAQGKEEEDWMVVDAEGKPEEDPEKADATGDSKASDADDTTGQ